MRAFDNDKILKMILLVTLFSGIFWNHLDLSKRAAFHNDEAAKISDAYYYNLFFIKHDYTNTDWNNDFYARTNPPVAKYIMGAYLHMGGYTIPDLSLQQKFERLWKNPQALFQEISKPMLLYARSLIVIFSVLTLMVVYLIGRLSGSVATGVMGILLLGCNPYFQYYSTVAITDMILLLFMSVIVLIVLCSMKFFRSQSQKHSSMLTMVQLTAVVCLVAFVIAAAVGTKLNGALTGIFFVISLLPFFYFSNRFSGHRSITLPAVQYFLIVTGTTLIAISVFILINPYLYRNAFTKLLYVLGVYDDWMLKQALDAGYPLWSGVQKITAIGVFNFSMPQASFFTSTIPFLFLIFCVGLTCIIIHACRELAGRKYPVWHFTILTWIIVYMIGIGMWIPVMWDRYFLPLAPLIAVVSAYGIAAFCGNLRLLFKIRSVKRERKKMFYVETIGAGCAVILGFVLWHIIIDESLLPPSLFLRNHDQSEHTLKMYEMAQQKHPTDPIRMINTASLKLISHDPAGACLLYERAIRILEEQKPTNRQKTMVALAQNSLAKSYSSLLKYKESIMMMESYIDTIKNITRNLQTDDKKVIEEFKRTITEKENDLKALRQMQNHQRPSDH